LENHLNHQNMILGVTKVKQQSKVSR
jgi:hypothetical protein